MIVLAYDPGQVLDRFLELKKAVDDHSRSERALMLRAASPMERSSARTLFTAFEPASICSRRKEGEQVEE